MTRTMVIYDSEWTSWDGAYARAWSGPGEEKELVQIGMVKLADTPNLEEIEQFEVLIQPQINPVLSDYFINLTGTTQDILDQHGRPLSEILPSVKSFLNQNSIAVYCFGTEDEEVLRHNCYLNKLKYPIPSGLFVSIVSEVADFIGIRDDELESSKLPSYFEFSPPGNAHNAIADARCIAEALRTMRKANAF